MTTSGSNLPQHFGDVYTLAPVAETTSPNESKLLLEYIFVLGRSKGILFLLALAGLAAGLLFSYLQTPIYQARATVAVQGINGDYLNVKSFDPTTAFQDYSPEGEILTQAKLMESDVIVEGVAAKIKAGFAKEQTAAITSMEAGLNYASSTAEVRLIPGTHILELLCSSTDKRIAAEFVNVWAQEYIGQNMNERIRVTQDTETLLQAQLSGVKQKLEKAEQDLLGYARRSNLMFTGEGQTSIAEDKLRQVQQTLSEVESERAAKQSQFELSTSAAPESLPAVMDDATGREMQGKLGDLKAQLADLRTYMAPTNPKVVRVEAQIADIEAALKALGQKIAKRIANEYETVRRRENLVRSNYEAQSSLVVQQEQKAIQYNILKRDVDTNRALYESLLQKAKEAGVAKAMRANNLRLVDSAKVPGRPYKPRTIANAFMGLMVGLFLGIAFVTLRERADYNIRSPGESSICLRVPELGAIPTTQPGARDLRLMIREDEGAAHSERSADSSLLAESFRATLASLLFSPKRADGSPAIVITSAAPSEGKSTIISNLGIAMAETDRKVLLVDGDLRKPHLHEIFGIANSGGLTEWLRSDDLSAEAISRRVVAVNHGSGLYVLPAGPPIDNISNLLYSVRLPKLLQRLREEFDAVLIDSPPMLQVPDARVLGRVAGAVVLVIRAGHTSRDTALAAKRRFAEDGTPVMGTILNDWNVRTASGPGYRKYYTANGNSSGRNGKSTA